MEHAKGAPGAFTVEVGDGAEAGRAKEEGPGGAEEWEGCGEGPECKPALKFAARHVFCPGRKEGHDEVESAEHRDEPKMSADDVGWKVEEEFGPGAVEAPCIDAHPNEERDEDAFEAAAEEGAGGLREREEEVGAGHDEEGDAGADGGVDCGGPGGVPM